MELRGNNICFCESKQTCVNQLTATSITARVEPAGSCETDHRRKSLKWKRVNREYNASAGGGPLEFRLQAVWPFATGGIGDRLKAGLQRSGSKTLTPALSQRKRGTESGKTEHLDQMEIQHQGFLL